MAQDYLKVIRLGYGAGQPNEGACWMSALGAHMNGEWTGDEVECVDPVIAALCVAINDYYGNDNDLRTAAIMNFGLFDPLGTRGTQAESELRFAVFLGDFLRGWLPAIIKNLATRYAIPAEPTTRKRTAIVKHLITTGVMGSLQAVIDTVQVAEIIAADDAFPFDPIVSFVHDAFQTIRNSAASFQYAWTTSLGYKQRRRAVLNVIALLSAAIETISAYWPCTKSDLVNGYVNTHMFPTLRTLIDMGPRGPKEVELPACGVEKFHSLIGCQVGNR